MQYNIHDAKTHFSKLVAAVERGERVTICRNGKPVIECVPSKSNKPFPFGALADRDKPAPDLSYMAEPTDDDLLDEMGL